MTPTRPQARRFRTFGIATVVLVYLVILAGGIVRSTGSGMGCPDWPKCFGSWVPPTEVSQLPADYQTRYAIPGHVPVFNPVKTWIEYLNRLLGALCGVAVFGTLVFSLHYWRSQPGIVWAALAAFLLIGFQGWLGAKVVSHVLAPWIVTVHMLLALVIVGILIYAVAWPQIRVERSVPGAMIWWVAICLLVVMIQISLGTQVREAVDVAAENVPNGHALWLDQVGSIFKIHRSFTWMVVLCHAGAVRRGYQDLSGIVGTAAQTAAICLLSTAVLGITMWLADFPAWAQPLHLLLASLLAGAYVFWLLVVVKARTAPAA